MTGLEQFIFDQSPAIFVLLLAVMVMRRDLIAAYKRIDDLEIELALIKHDLRQAKIDSSVRSVRS